MLLYGIGLLQFVGYVAVELELFVEAVDKLTMTTVRSLTDDMLSEDKDTSDDAEDNVCELSVLEDLLDSDLELRELELTRLREIELSERELKVLMETEVLEDSEILEGL